jgi:hypothetical protein
MCNIYRGPSIDASYQLSVNLYKRFQRRILKISTNQKQELPMVAMFITGSDEMSNLYRGPSIVASYQVSVHLAKRFQRRRI